MRDPFPVLVLIGLIMDIVGAFLLASEFIGVERVRQWATRLGHALNRAQSYRGVLVAVLLVGLALTTRYRVTQLAERGSPEYPRLLSLPAITILAVYLGAFLLFVSLRLHRFLALTPALVKERAAGVLGFNLLLGGFVLQFLGALGTFILTNFR